MPLAARARLTACPRCLTCWPRDQPDRTIRSLHLQRLVGEWQLLSDLAFADLLLWVPVEIEVGDADAVPGFLCVAQCRPTTGPTAYQQHQVGVVQRGQHAVPLQTALSEGRIFRETEPDWDGDLPIRREAIPVRCDGEVIAVLGRDANLASVRTPSQLELVYLQSAADLSAMVADGTFPAPDAGLEEGSGPRVGDGLAAAGAGRDDHLRQPQRAVRAEPSGHQRGGAGRADRRADQHRRRRPVRRQRPGRRGRGGDRRRAAGQHRDRRRGSDGVVPGAARCVRARETLGALLLMQDVTELRRRDRQIMSKDATIREIHHRVKNNLQTVAALLRLQARRVTVPEARAALEESMRRVSSIALVHETLSGSIDDDVGYDDIVDRLLVMLVGRDGNVGTDSGQAAGQLRRASRPRRRRRWCSCSPNWCRTPSSTRSRGSARAL